jgi:hypothetical protein
VVHPKLPGLAAKARMASYRLLQMVLVRGVRRSFIGGFPLVIYLKLNVGPPGTGMLTKKAPGGSRGAFLYVMSSWPRK